MEPDGGFASPPPGCPAHGTVAGEPLYGDEFAAQPDVVYERLREYGPAAPVQLAPGVDATLVTDYGTALKILQNPGTFARDSRRWRAFRAGEVPMDSPVVPMMAYRPNLLFSDGVEHLRLRSAVTESLGRLDTRRLTQTVERVSAYLVDQFSARGNVDLLREYARPLPLLVFNEIFGCPADIGDRVVRGISGIFDGVENADQVLTQGLMELVTLKRRQPGEDVTSWLAQHPARLTDEEMISELVVMLGGGTEPQQNLIAHGLLLILSEVQQSNGRPGAGMLVEEAIETVLWNSAPIANYAAHYPVQDVEISGVRFPADEPVLISFAAANNDPSLDTARATLSKRAHLAWGAGPHACPAKESAQLVSILAIEKLLNQLPDIELTVPVGTLTWRPGPFHRALNSLPVRFMPTKSANSSPVPQQALNSSQNTKTRRQERDGEKGSRWSAFLKWWRG